MASSKPKSPEKGYIYLLREREFINCNRELYKIGRTGHHVNQRLGKYPKSSELFIVIQVDNQLLAESTLLRKFRKEFDNRTEIGAEYFEGDLSKMKEIIIKYSLGDWSFFESEINDANNEEDDDENANTEKMSETEKSATELREECRKLGLATRGTKDHLIKKLELYRSIENLPPDTIKTLANSQNIKLTKKGKELRLEYVKKFLGSGGRKFALGQACPTGVSTGSESTEEVSAEEDEVSEAKKSDGENSSPPKNFLEEFTDLQRRFGVLESEIAGLRELLKKLEDDLVASKNFATSTKSDVVRLEALVANLMGRVDLLEKPVELVKK